MWSHKKLKGSFSGNYEYNKAGYRKLYLEKYSASGKKIASHKFNSHQQAKKSGWSYTKSN